MKPTNVNNVETLANVPLIIREGGDWYAAIGVESGKGTKLFSLSGDIERAGVLEVPFGEPLSLVINEIGRGTSDGHSLKAVQPGGPLSGFVPAGMVDLPLDRNAFSNIGTLLGSGGLVVLDERRCIVEYTRMMMVFDQDESCARCTTCRIGAMRLVDICDRVASGSGRLSDFDTIDLLDRLMKDANCVHGQFTPYGITAAVRHFRSEWEAHIRDQRCDAKVCEGLVRYFITAEQCTNCGECAEVCPTNVIVKQGDAYTILQENCIKCGACLEACPDGAVEVASPVPRELAFVGRPQRVEVVTPS